MASNVGTSEISSAAIAQAVSPAAREALIAILGEGEKAVTAGISGAVTAATLQSLKDKTPEVLILGGTGSTSTTNTVNLSALGADIAEVKALIFEGNQPVALDGLKGFSGIIALGDGSNKVNAAKTSGDVAVTSGKGNDSVATGSGSDSITLGGGKDTVSTGSGGDEVSIQGAVTGGVVKTGTGDDKVKISASGGASVSLAVDGGKGKTDMLDLSAVDIKAVTVKGGTATVTLADGTKVAVKGMEAFVYNVTIDGAEVTKVVGLSNLADDFS